MLPSLKSLTLHNSKRALQNNVEQRPLFLLSELYLGQHADSLRLEYSHFFPQQTAESMPKDENVYTVRKSLSCPFQSVPVL